MMRSAPCLWRLRWKLGSPGTHEPSNWSRILKHERVTCQGRPIYSRTVSMSSPALECTFSFWQPHAPAALYSPETLLLLMFSIPNCIILIIDYNSTQILSRTVCGSLPWLPNRYRGNGYENRYLSNSPINRNTMVTNNRNNPWQHGHSSEPQ
jgi:hypothetical protein